MVGVSTSRACMTCRKRKIKCDESLPNCNQCLRSHRECVPAQNKIRFVEAGSSLQKRDIPPVGGRLVDVSGQSLYEETGAEWQVTDWKTKNGTLFQRWRTVSNISTVPSASLEISRLELASCFECGSQGFRMNHLGSWLTDIPARLGECPALDNAAAVLASTHSAMIRRQPAEDCIDHRSYVKALASLRKGLADSSELSAHILAATAILYYTESVVGSLDKFNALHHAGGVARLLEARGPGKVENEFERRLISQIRGPVIIHSHQTGVPCFLEQKAWAEIFQNPSGVSLYDNVMSLLTKWPRFASENRAFLAGEMSPLDTANFLYCLRAAKENLDHYGTCIQDILKEGVKAKYVKTARQDSIFPTMIDYPDGKFANAIMMHALCALILNRILALVEERLNISPRSHTATQDQLLSIRIWQSYEYASRLYPIGSQFIILPLTMSYLHVESEITRAWVLASFNKLICHRIPYITLDDTIVRHLCKRHTGEGPAVAAK